MSVLVNLVRLNRWHLDEGRRKLAELERLGERLRDDLARLEAGLEAERRAAAASEAARHAYPAFLRAELERRQRLEASMAEVDREAEAAREEVAAAFREVKKVELALERRRRHADERRARAEQARLDEVGVERHRRRPPDG